MTTETTHTPTSGPTLGMVDVALIEESLTNPRKTFDPLKLQDLANSIKATGVHQPVLLRPLPGSRLADTFGFRRQGAPLPVYELVCGARRLRACRMAGVTEIPAMVRELTDQQALEAAVIENLQREDVSELEEAEGYEYLMQQSHMSAEDVGGKIGKSRSYIYARLKLLDLCSEARTSLRDGTIDASRALVVARIPDHKLQIKAMKEIVAGSGYSHPREPMSYREALDHVQHNYMLKLSDAKFDTADADLVAPAGSCKTCPKRTGHNPDLFPEVKSADVCIDPPCYHSKEDAHGAQLVAAAQAKGQTVIFGREAAELMIGSNWAEKVKGYRRLDHAEDSPTDQPLRKLIGKQMLADGIKPVAIAHPTKKGVLVECLPNETVLKLLKAVEHQASASEKTATKEVQKLVNDKKAKAEDKAKAQYEKEWRTTLLHDAWCAMRDDAEIKAYTSDVHRYLAVRAARSLSTDNAAALCKLLGLGPVSPCSAMADHAQDTPNPELLNLLIIMQEAASPNEHSYGGRKPNEGLLLVAGNVFGAKLDEVIKEIKAEVQARIWAKVAKTPPQPQATASDLPLASAAPAGGVRAGAEGGKGKPRPAARAGGSAPLRKPKTSAAEAQAQIAAAMQAQETDQGADAQGIEAGSGFALPGTPAQAGGSIDVGVRVKVLASARGPKQAKWVGKTGTIKSKIGPQAWDVLFTAKGKGVATYVSFHTTELEAA